MVLRARNDNTQRRRVLRARGSAPTYDTRLMRSGPKLAQMTPKISLLITSTTTLTEAVKYNQGRLTTAGSPGRRLQGISPNPSAWDCRSENFRNRYALFDETSGASGVAALTIVGSPECRFGIGRQCHTRYIYWDCRGRVSSGIAASSSLV